MGPRAWMAFGVRVAAGVAGVAVITHAGVRIIPVNAAAIGFAYLLWVLLIASTWGFVEAACASVASTLAFNFFFLPPTGAFTVADPQNWVALFTFLTTSIVASRLSTAARERASEAVEHQKDLERLYTFSRAILLLDPSKTLQRELTSQLAAVFGFTAIILFDRRTGEIYRAGPDEFEGLDAQIRDSALQGSWFADPDGRRTITPVRLGAEPIASLALQGPPMPDGLVQSISNLVAIGLERATADALAHQMEVARRSEQLRTTLIDAVAHELKTPLTSIRAATTALLADPDQPRNVRLELIRIADEETERLRTLIDDAIEVSRLDSAEIEVQPDRCSLADLVREVLSSMENEIDSRPVAFHPCASPEAVLADRRLIKLAVRQLVDNALKYSPPGSAIELCVRREPGQQVIEVTDHGQGISAGEQTRVFERFWRSPSVQNQMPGTGLGLSIANSIAAAHDGDLTVHSRPGKTTFCLRLPEPSTVEAA